MTVRLSIRWLTLLGSFLVMLGALPLSLSATQAATQDISIWTYENDGSGPVYDVCYVLVGYSQEGCDLNGDGGVFFEDVAYGTYTVTQTADLGTGRYVSDFTIVVDGGLPTFTAFVITEGVDMPIQDEPSLPADGARNLYIATVADDASYYDACYVLVGYSLVGCDDNRDGYVLFEDVEYGTYIVRQTADIAPYTIDEFEIEFSPQTDNVFYAFLERGAPNVVATSDLSLITRDPDSGELLTGACYELVNASNVGCDRNGDGQVDFAEIPIGEHTVRQVTAPRGYDLIEDFPIFVTTTWDSLGIVVKQDRLQSQGRTDNVSIVFLDGNTFERVAHDNICVRLAGATQIGCDEQAADGQIDFLDVEYGVFEMEIASLPDGYTLWDPDQRVIVDGTDVYPTTVWSVFLVPEE